MRTFNRTWKYQVLQRGSAAVEAMEAAWELLREIEPAIPPAVLTLVDARSRAGIRGYFAGTIWKKRRGAAHEIAVSPKLISNPRELLATMLHEAAHAVLYESGKNGGMGSTPYYHTKTFRDQCVRFGLDCEFKDTRYGWTLTGWPAQGMPERYKPVVAVMRKQLPAGPKGLSLSIRKGRALPLSGHIRLVCKCESGDRSIYVKKSVFESGGVLCEFCHSIFRSPR